jgi:hypothetical protein
MLTNRYDFGKILSQQLKDSIEDDQSSQITNKIYNSLRNGRIFPAAEPRETVDVSDQKSSEANRDPVAVLESMVSKLMGVCNVDMAREVCRILYNSGGGNNSPSLYLLNDLWGTLRSDVVKTFNVQKVSANSLAQFLLKQLELKYGANYLAQARTPGNVLYIPPPVPPPPGEPLPGVPPEVIIEGGQAVAAPPPAAVPLEPAGANWFAEWYNTPRNLNIIRTEPEPQPIGHIDDALPAQPEPNPMDIGPGGVPPRFVPRFFYDQGTPEDDEYFRTMRAVGVAAPAAADDYGPSEAEFAARRATQAHDEGRPVHQPIGHIGDTPHGTQITAHRLGLRRRFHFEEPPPMRVQDQQPIGHIADSGISDIISMATPVQTTAAHEIPGGQSATITESLINTPAGIGGLFASADEPLDIYLKRYLGSYSPHHKLHNIQKQSLAVHILDMPGTPEQRHKFANIAASINANLTTPQQTYLHERLTEFDEQAHTTPLRLHFDGTGLRKHKAYKSSSSTSQRRRDIEILRGEIRAGNNNPIIAKSLKFLTSHK